MLPRLSARRLPPKLAGFVPLAERWGISDDAYRAEAVLGATDSELKDLVSSFQPGDRDAPALDELQACNASNFSMTTSVPPSQAR
jgi:hypothetical protein